MKLYYITSKTYEEAGQIGRALVGSHLAHCVNWFPITRTYSWEGKITEEEEVALIVKTKEQNLNVLESLIAQCTDRVASLKEIEVNGGNQHFMDWLNFILPERSLQTVSLRK